MNIKYTPLFTVKMLQDAVFALQLKAQDFLHTKDCVS